MQEALFESGAVARSAGLDALANPFFDEAAMPSATGESIEDWGIKLSTWHAGWQAEPVGDAAA
jgi:hypothetical protein